VTKTLSCRDGETARHDPRTRIRTVVPHSPLERLKIDDWNQVSGMMQSEVSYGRAQARSTKTDSDERANCAGEVFFTRYAFQQEVPFNQAAVRGKLAGKRLA
jgi:hypothetical protein